MAQEHDPEDVALQERDPDGAPPDEAERRARVLMLLRLDLPKTKSGEIAFSTLRELAAALEHAEREVREAGRLGEHVSELTLAGIHEGSTDIVIGQDYADDFVREDEVPLGVIWAGMSTVANGDDCPPHLEQVDKVLQGVLASGGKVQFGADGGHLQPWIARKPMATASPPAEARWRVRLIGKIYEINYKSCSARLALDGRGFRILKGLTEAQLDRIDRLRRGRAEVLVRSVDADGSHIIQILAIDDATGENGVYSSPLVRPALFDAVNEKIDELGEIGGGWYGPGTVGPTDKAVRGMRRMFTDIFDSLGGDVPQPRVVPGPGGELQIEWEHADDRYVELLVRGDGNWEYLIRDERGEREGTAQYERALRLAVMYLRGVG